jgi:hypothetical protein
MSWTQSPVFEAFVFPRRLPPSTHRGLIYINTKLELERFSCFRSHANLQQVKLAITLQKIDGHVTALEAEEARTIFYLGSRNVHVFNRYLDARFQPRESIVILSRCIVIISLNRLSVGSGVDAFRDLLLARMHRQGLSISTADDSSTRPC